MSNKGFVLVSVESAARGKAAEIQPILNKAIDWIEVKPLTWLLWTTSDSKRWYARLKPKIGQGERVFICAVDATNRSGWMPRAFWDFIKKHQ